MTWTWKEHPQAKSRGASINPTLANMRADMDDIDDIDLLLKTRCSSRLSRNYYFQNV